MSSIRRYQVIPVWDREGEDMSSIQRYQVIPVWGREGRICLPSGVIK